MNIKQNGNVTSVWEDVSSGWEEWHLLMSDVHHDSIYCNRELEKEHLDKALKREASIWIFGDLFDSMQGRFDKRRSMNELRPEYKRDDYYDFVVKDVGDFLQPYAENIRLVTPGNHESSVLRHANTSLTDRLVFYLNTRYGARVQSGGYGGWIRFLFNMSNGVATGPRTSLRVKYFHGAGGEAPVTRGVIQTNRQAVYLPDADVVINGHNHHSFLVPINRERLTNKGQQRFDIQWHVRIPGYKMDYADGSGGWMVERGGVPKPVGCVWMKMSCNNSEIRLNFDLDLDGGYPLEPAGVGVLDEYEPYPIDSEYP